MVACAACGGCCAHCGASCGAFSGVGMGGGGFGAPMGGGGSFFPMGGLAGFGFLPFFGLRQRHPAATPDDGSTPVDSDALVDQNNPGHREAIQTISHVDDEKHENILQWIKDELHKLEA